ncbi:MAG: intradiol ring-cleavage dioxygenase [Cytophagales bacterium]
MRFLLSIVSFVILSCTGKSTTIEKTNAQPNLTDKNGKFDPSCEWCGANEAPLDIDWKTTIAGPDEAGERMIISGTVFMKDGKTPAKDVIVYVYHTNTEGVYPKKGDEQGNGKRHGYLRAWMKTNANGQYQFESIRPAAYQKHGGEPAHIHYVIKAPGQEEYWLDALMFDDDPRLDPETRANVPNRGQLGSITKLMKNENNVFEGKRDIILKDF